MEKSSLMMIVIIVLLVALLGTVVVVTFYALNLVQDMEAGLYYAQTWDRTPRPTRPDEVNRVMVGGAIITNLASETGGVGPMARIQVVVGYDNTQGRDSDAIAELIEEQMTHIRMTALDSIGSRTYRELSSRDGRLDLADEILQTLQNDFMTNMIVEVGFYEFILP